MICLLLYLQDKQNGEEGCILLDINKGVELFYGFQVCIIIEYCEILIIDDEEDVFIKEFRKVLE